QGHGSIRLLKSRTPKGYGVRPARRGCVFGPRRPTVHLARVPRASSSRSSRLRRRRTTWPCDVPEGFPSVSFAACFVYSPRGVEALCEASRRLCSRVKAVDREWFPRYAGLAYRTSLHDPQLEGLFALDVALVAVPGCTPSSDPPCAAGERAGPLTLSRS